jgi:hypothetical protein
MCPHTTCAHACDAGPHTTTCVLILLHMSPHTTICHHTTTCVLILLYMCRQSPASEGLLWSRTESTIYVSHTTRCYYKCVLILLHTCRQSSASEGLLSRQTLSSWSSFAKTWKASAVVMDAVGGGRVTRALLLSARVCK